MPKGLPVKKIQNWLKTSQMGFTMLELLIVIVVVGALGTMFLITYPGIQTSAQDAKRKSDIKEYQAALEFYALKHDDHYPVKTSTVDVYEICPDLGLDVGSEKCAKDPDSSSGQTGYNYQSDSAGTKYALWTALEKDENGADWAVCSGGANGVLEGSVSGGSCPVVPEATAAPTSTVATTPTSPPGATATPTTAPTATITVTTAPAATVAPTATTAPTPTFSFRSCQCDSNGNVIYNNCGGAYCPRCQSFRGNYYCICSSFNCNYIQ